MVKSMTGYGRNIYENNQRQYTLEIKSVNHKYCDISIKMPKTLSFLEEKIKKEVIKYISRGKVDIFITFLNNGQEGKNIIINKEIAKLYIKEIQRLQEETGISKDILPTEILKLPDVLTIENNEDEELLWNELQIPLNNSLKEFVEMREIEGSKMAEDILKRLKSISEKIDKISLLSTGLIEEYVVKLEDRIKELLKTDVVDKTRIATEVVIYADKCSIEEEITRLRSHINQFENLLKCENVGKKLDFLVQEMNRETNTIGSKANSLEITNCVVDIKSEIENIREQIQNIE